MATHRQALQASGTDCRPKHSSKLSSPHKSNALCHFTAFKFLAVGIAIYVRGDSHDRRMGRILHCNVTGHPTAEGVIATD